MTVIAKNRRLRLLRNMNLLSVLYGGIHTIYGPYLCRDGRYRVVLYDGYTRLTRQYAKLKMEIKLGRRLHEDRETIDHLDNNVRNDRYSNLRVISRAEHSKQDATRRASQDAVCVWCSETFTLSRAQLGARDTKTKAGPFCSKTCTGKYGASIRAGSKKIKRVKYLATYERNTKKK